MPLRKNRKYTYSDYLSWPDEERWELIEGVPYNMTPSPSVKHQRIVWNIVRELSRHLEENKACQGFSAPTDVVFDEHNVVQPDVFVVCDKTKIGEGSIKGAPDLIIEVISPSTEVKDKREKKHLYEKFKVSEYILIFPESEYVERYVLQEDKYGAPEVINWDETMKIVTLGMEMNLWELFDKERPSETEERGEN